MSRRRPEWDTCTDCGAAVYKRRRYGVAMRCTPCGIRRAVDAARQMSDKQGPMWEAWCASNADGAPGRTDQRTEE